MPHLNAFISLLGAFCSTALALLLPAVIELILAYGTVDGGPTWALLVKNALIIGLAVLGLVTGTWESVGGLYYAFFHED